MGSGPSFIHIWLKYSLSFLLRMAQVFVSKTGSNIHWHVAQIFVDIHIQGMLTNLRIILDSTKR